MNWVIVGQGAMGLLWYHHLNTYMLLSSNKHDQTNNTLSLLASKQHDLTNTCYQFTSVNKQVVKGIIHFTKIEQLQAADNILLCLKSYQITDAISEIAKHIKVGCNVILAHNGMGTVEQLPEKFIEHHNIYTLLSTHGCLRSAPLTITHTGAGESHLGLISGKQGAFQAKQLTTMLNQALPITSLASNIAKKQWLKLAINCVINPITAINNIDNGLVNNVKFIKKIQTILTEVSVIAATQGIELSIDELCEQVSKVAQATSKNTSSMRCDILANRKTEVDYINGYIHRLGEQYQIATPENTQLWQKIKQLEVQS